MMSTTNDASRTFCVARYVKPPRTSLNPARRDVPVGGIAGSFHTAHSVARRKIESSRYSSCRPADGMRTPASSGPAIAPNCTTVMFSEFAAGNCLPGINRGMIAARVGWFTAKNAC